MSHFDLARLNILTVKNRASEARGLKNGKTKKGRKKVQLVPAYQLEAVEIQNSNSKDIHAIDDSQRSTRSSFIYSFTNTFPPINILPLYNSSLREYRNEM
jgi:hypothetical protein